MISPDFAKLKGLDMLFIAGVGVGFALAVMFAVGLVAWFMRHLVS